MPWIAPWRVIFEPRRMCVAAAERGGPRLLFGLVAWELVLTQPKVWTGALLRAPGAPLISTMILVQTYLSAVAGPLMMLLVVALAYNLVARLCGRGADLWAVLGALSAAWVAHTLAIALAVCLHRTQMAPLGQDTAPWLLGAPAVYGAYALWTLWQRGALHTRVSAVAAPSPRAKQGALWVCGVFVLAGLVTLRDVQMRWGEMRPKLAGDLVPAFQLDGVNGEALHSAQLAGHVTLIDFWATWCGPCMRAMPELERLHRSLGPQGLRLVAVNVEVHNRAGIQSVIDSQHLTLPIYEDSAHLADAMHVHVYPTSFLVDAHGRIVRVYAGPADGADLERQIAALLSDAAAPSVGG